MLAQQVVVLGNHRDAWVAGAIDPTSGTAAVLETGRALAELRDQGWKPRRTIVWCSWDAEEYGLLGSTEWAEQHDNLLRARAVTYINLDSAVSGGSRGFGASATPNYDHIIREVAQKVYDPEGVYPSLYDAWSSRYDGAEPRLGRLGSGSDYTPFLQHLGIPSISLSYSGTYPVYHSQYDSFDWTRRFADEITEACPTGFCRHAAMATYVGALVLRIADDRILPMNYTHYALEMMGYAETIASSVARDGGIADAPPTRCHCDQPVERSGACPAGTSADDGCPIGKCRFDSPEDCESQQISMTPVRNALSAMLDVTVAVEEERERLSEPGNSEVSAVRDLNDRLVVRQCRALHTVLRNTRLLSFLLGCFGSSRNVPFARAKACVIVLGSSTWCATRKRLVSLGCVAHTKAVLGGLARFTLQASSIITARTSSRRSRTPCATRSTTPIACPTGRTSAWRSLGRRKLSARQLMRCAHRRCRSAQPTSTNDEPAVCVFVWWRRQRHVTSSRLEEGNPAAEVQRRSRRWRNVDSRSGPALRIPAPRGGRDHPCAPERWQRRRHSAQPSAPR